MTLQVEISHLLFRGRNSFGELCKDYGSYVYNVVHKHMAKATTLTCSSNDICSYSKFAMAPCVWMQDCILGGRVENVCPISIC